MVCKTKRAKNDNNNELRFLQIYDIISFISFDINLYIIFRKIKINRNRSDKQNEIRNNL